MYSMRMKKRFLFIHHHHIRITSAIRVLLPWSPHIIEVHIMIHHAFISMTISYASIQRYSNGIAVFKYIIIVLIVHIGRHCFSAIIMFCIIIYNYNSILDNQLWYCCTRIIVTAAITPNVVERDFYIYILYYFGYKGMCIRFSGHPANRRARDADNIYFFSLTTRRENDERE